MSTFDSTWRMPEFKPLNVKKKIIDFSKNVMKIIKMYSERRNGGKTYLVLERRGIDATAYKFDLNLQVLYSI